MAKHFRQTDGSHLLSGCLSAAKRDAAYRLLFAEATDYDSLPAPVKAQYSRKTFNRVHNIECAGCGLVSCQCALERAEAEEMWEEEGL